jgi:phage head maturation protease
VSKIRDGIIRDVSVGYTIHRVEKTENVDSDDEWRVVDWEPLEISAVPIPADAGSQIRKADKAEQFTCVVVSGGIGSLRAAATRARMRCRQRMADLI